MCVRDHVHQLPRFEPGGSCKHHQKNAVLHHVPVARSQHVLAALVQNSVERIAAHVERHRVGARVQMHIFEIFHIVHMRDDAAACGRMFQVVQDLVYLIENAFAKFVFFPQLIAVRLTDRAAPVRPTVPDMAGQIVNVIAFFLPDP